MGTGVKAVYEDIVLLNWLRKNNSSEFQYKAVFFYKLIFGVFLY